MGNRLTKTETGLSTAYTYYPATNRMYEAVTGPETIIHAFDPNGNITGMGGKILTYNQDNRLMRVEENSVTLGEYIYNGLGQRIIKNAGGVTTVFHYDFDGNIIAESDQSGSISREYLYKGSSRLAMVDVLTGNMYYYGNDKLGTPQIMTDSTNTVVWEGVYKPFGEADVNPNSSVVNNFRFPGQYFDTETGLHYNYHRYYDSGIGRYLTPDPIGLDGGINLFAYVGNNPISREDPRGLASIVTDMQAGTTTFDPRPEDPNSEPYTIATSNDVTANALPGAQDPFTTPDVNPINGINMPAFGPPRAYIDTGDPRGRDIHGGGTGLRDPYAPRQGWVPTRGCTRGQNEDIQELNRRITDFRQRHHGVQIPYTRR